MLVEDADCFLSPLLLLHANLPLKFIKSTLLTIFLDLLELFLNFGEGSGGIVDEKVVHHIGVVSLKRYSIWSDNNGLDTLNLPGLVILIIWLWLSRGGSDFGSFELALVA